MTVFTNTVTVKQLSGFFDKETTQVFLLDQNVNNQSSKVSEFMRIEENTLNVYPTDNDIGDYDFKVISVDSGPLKLSTNYLINLTIL